MSNKTTSESLQNGFTLIELVIVIVILAVLASTAFAKFNNLATEARIATVHAMQGAMSSTASLVQMKLNIENVKDGFITLNGNPIAVNDGYITGHWNNAWRYALDVGQEITFTKIADECTVNEICGVGNQRTADGIPISTNGSKGLVLIWLKGMKLEDLCYAFYYNPNNGDAPTTGSVTTGC
ncbi:type II secretion system protein [Psychromonas algarum]|uniref:type II secretion system protein n=1 Tax=Psychromonas algarum TaxID=2555643 RepID=UPI0014191430|nr:prepilin-type N-terminal cleavage/methylation domain-containing protein [Psychromonas sp. RZ22]